MKKLILGLLIVTTMPALTKENIFDDKAKLFPTMDCFFTQDKIFWLNIKNESNTNLSVTFHFGQATDGDLNDVKSIFIQVSPLYFKEFRSSGLSFLKIKEPSIPGALATLEHIDEESHMIDIYSCYAESSLTPNLE